MIPRVAVLLAGFDGQKYLYEQVFSLLNQKRVSVDIFIRVDGDSSIFTDMVIQLASEFKNIHFLQGDFLSSSGMNFYRLIIGMQDKTFDFYALCDQDDIWEDTKLQRAVECLTDKSVSGYSSGFTTFNSTGMKKRHSNGQQSKFDHFFQSSGPGCTFVFDRAGFVFLREYLLENHELLSVLAHDWLIYFVFRFNNIGWRIDSESHLLYRQHSSNVAGVNSGFGAKIKRAKLLFSGWYISDLLLLMSFARRRGFTPRFFSPLQLRRSKAQSIFIWLYYWLFVKNRLECEFNSEST